jgi:hypothetical protein
MEKLKYLILHVTIAVSLLFYIGGCSSGGGGGGSDGDDGLTYSGLTTPAELSDQNAEDISGGALGAGLIGDGMSGFSSLDRSSDENFVREFRTVKVPQILSDSLHLIDYTETAASATQAALDTTIESTEEGNCGGRVSYSVRADDLEGTFSGSFTYSAYCNDGTTINGKASFEVKMDPETLETENPEPVEAYLSFETLSGGDLTLDGEIDIDFKDSGYEVTFNAYGQDPVSRKVYWIDNYRIAIDEGQEEIEGEEAPRNFVRVNILSGNFYHPDHGYVTLITEEPFVLYPDNDDNPENDWPVSGILVVTGANNKKAKIAAVDHEYCNVEADLDGNNEYETDLGDMRWDEM